MRKFHEGRVFGRTEKAIKHNIRTHADIVYKQGDMFYNRANNRAWKGPGTMVHFM